MTLDTQLQTLLAAMAREGAANLVDMPITELRAWYAQLGERLGGQAPPMEDVRNLSVPAATGYIPLRLYRPNRLAPQLQPGLIYVHGGGWTMGSLDTHDKECRRLAQACGAIVMSVGYRLAPEHPFPAGPEDVIAATGWLLANAVNLGVDAGRLGIAGDSAGGSLAAVACLANRMSTGPTLCCQILIYPGTDNSPERPQRGSRVAQAQTPPLSASAIGAMVSCFLPNPADGLDWRASPLLAPDHARLPPALVITGGYDPLRDEGIAYAQRLAEAGVDVLHRHYAGMIHGFFEMGGALDAVGDAVQTIAFWFKRHSRDPH